MCSILEQQGTYYPGHFGTKMDNGQSPDQGILYGCFIRSFGGKRFGKIRSLLATVTSFCVQTWEGGQKGLKIAVILKIFPLLLGFILANLYWSCILLKAYQRFWHILRYPVEFDPPSPVPTTRCLRSHPIDKRSWPLILRVVVTVVKGVAVAELHHLLLAPQRAVKNLANKKETDVRWIVFQVNVVVSLELKKFLNTKKFKDNMYWALLLICSRLKLDYQRQLTFPQRQFEQCFLQ